MKNHLRKRLSYILMGLAAFVVLTDISITEVKADGGSSYDCYLEHDFAKCCGADTGQNYLNGTTHVFKLTVPAEISSYPVTWTASGTDIQNNAVNVEFLETSDTSATVKFTGTHASAFRLGVDINATVNLPEGQGSAFADYWLDVYDEFYYSPTPTYIPLDIGTSQKLTCEVLKFDTAHPKGVPTALTDNLTWENAFPNVDTGIMVSADGTVEPSSGGMYMVLATLKDASPYVSKQFNIMVPVSTLVSEQKVSVPSSYRGIVYVIKATVSGDYQLQYPDNARCDILDSAGKCLKEVNGETAEGMRSATYSLTAETTYYVNVIHSSSEPVSLMLTAPEGSSSPTTPEAPVSPAVPETKIYTITFDKNGGTQLSSSDIKVTVNETYGALPTIGRKGYAFKGWYTSKSGGTKVTSDTKVTISNNQTLYAQWTKVKAPSKTKILTIKNKKGKKMSIKLKKISGAKGYQIVYATNAKLKGSKKVTITSLAKTISKLNKRKTYYVKVRAYKLDSLNNKIYGSYSTVKKIKIKK